jgi:hypothetical protein
MPDQRGEGAAAKFRRVWIEADDASTAYGELLPVRLARACVEVLPVDGAGLSLHDTAFRVPLGANDDVATLAERLQFTQGEGPCLEASSERRVVVASPAVLQERWPAFTDELFRHTPYRAIASVPLALTPRSFGALDLYFTDPDAVDGVSLVEVSAVCAEIVEALQIATDSAPTDDARAGLESDLETDLMPPWLTSAPARVRSFVWVAMGMIMTAYQLTAPDALAMLRSYAYGHDLLVDDLSVALADGTMSATELQS